MTTVLARRFLAEFARRPVNLILLVVVPVVFVALSAGVWAKFGQMVGTAIDPTSLVAATGGWAAAFLAGMAGYFHVSGARDADRRLATAGAPTSRIVAARMMSGLVLAAVGVAASLAALAVRTGIGDTPRTIAATAMFAAIYLAIGAVVGVLVRDEVNGAVVILFIWMVDVFLGPGMAGGDHLATRFLPTHFVTMLMTGAVPDHAGPLGNAGAALAWTGAALLTSLAVYAAGTRPGNRPEQPWWTGAAGRLAAGLRYGWREYRRNIVLWALLVVAPAYLIALSFAVTPVKPAPLTLGDTTTVVSRENLHGLIMIPITVALLAGTAGVFVVLGSAEADRRLVLAGFRPREVLGARLGVLTGAATLTTAASLIPVAAYYQPASWALVTGASLLTALTYAMIGVLVGPIVGRLGGFFVMFLLAFIDPGLGQDYLLGDPPSWATYLPAHGPVQALLHGGFTGTTDSHGLLLGLAWLTGITLAAVVVFHRTARPQHT